MRKVTFLLMAIVAIIAIGFDTALASEDQFLMPRLSKEKPKAAPVIDLSFSGGNGWFGGEAEWKFKGWDIDATIKQTNEKSRASQVSISREVLSDHLTLGLSNVNTRKKGESENELGLTCDLSIWRFRAGVAIPTNSNNSSEFSLGYQGRGYFASAKVSSANKPTVNISADLRPRLTLKYGQDNDTGETAYTAVIKEVGKSYPIDVNVTYVRKPEDQGNTWAGGATYHF